QETFQVLTNLKLMSTKINQRCKSWLTPKKPANWALVHHKLGNNCVTLFLEQKQEFIKKGAMILIFMCVSMKPIVITRVPFLNRKSLLEIWLQGKLKKFLYLLFLNILIIRVLVPSNIVMPNV